MDETTALLPLVGLSVFLALLLAEHVRPLRKQKLRLARRVLTNLLFSALALGIGVLAARPIVEHLIQWAADRPFGLLYLVELPFLVQFILGFLLMDLTFYYWHRLNHEIPFLWRFHSVHHIDPACDVTTSFRFHYGEILLSIGLRVCQVGLLGVTPLTYVIYEVVFQVSTMFHHSNLRLPLAFERALNWLIVTPRMHGIHHADRREQTNANYSVVLRLWDQLHRTLVLNVPQDHIDIGVNGFKDFGFNRFATLFILPFRAGGVVSDQPPKTPPTPTETKRTRMVE